MGLNRLEDFESLVAGALLALANKLFIRIHLNSLLKTWQCKSVSLARTGLHDMILFCCSAGKDGVTERTGCKRHDRVLKSCGRESNLIEVNISEIGSDGGKREGGKIPEEARYIYI